MDEIEYGFRFTDNLEGFDNFVNRLEQLEKKFEKIKGENPFEKIGEGAQELEGEVEDLVKDVSKLEQENKKLTAANNEAAGSFLESAKNTKVFGVSINDIKGKLEGFKTGLLASRDAAKAATVGTTGMSKALNILKIALVSTGIGAIVVALGSLITFLSTTQKGIDAVTSVTRPLAALFERSVGVIQNLGGALFDAFTNPLETLKSFGSAVGSFLLNPLEGVKNILSGIVSTAKETGEFVKESLEAGAELDRLQKNIERAEINAKTRREELNRIAKEGQQIAQDVSKTEAEREAAAVAGIAAIKERGQIDIDLINLRIAKKEKENALNDTSREDELALADLKAQSIRAEANAIQQTTRLNNNLNSVRTQAAVAQKKAADERKKAQNAELKRIKALNRAFDDQLKAFQDQVDEVISNNSSDADRAEQFRQKALADLLIAEQQLIAVAEAAGKPTGVITEGFEILAQNIEDEYRRTIDKLNQVQLDPLEVPAPELSTGDIDLPTLTLGKKIGEDQGDQFALNFGEKIQKFIAEDLGLDDKEVAALTEAINKVFASVQAGILSNTAAQIEQQDELIDSLKERVDATEEALDRELQLKIAGYANDYDALKDNLADQNALVEKAEQEKTDLKKKQLEQQLIADEISQASSLVTAIAGLLKNGGELGIVGIVIAGLAIAGMLATFAQYKQQVNQLSGLREGINPDYDRVERSGGKGFKIKGRSHEQGGELFSHGGVLWEAEKDEILMGTKASKKHSDFLFNLNKGKYDGLGPLDQLLDNPNLFNSLSSTIGDRSTDGSNIVTVINNSKESTSQELEEALDRALKKNNIDLINATLGTTSAVNKKPSLVAKPNGDLIEYIYNERGQVIVKRTIEGNERNKEEELNKTLEKINKKLK